MTSASALPSTDGSTPLPKTILVVEDGLVSKLVRAVLQRHGYAVTIAEATEAEALLQSPESHVGLLITNTPGHFLELAARVPLLYLTSQPDPVFETIFRDCLIVVKPFIPEDLVAAAAALLGSV